MMFNSPVAQLVEHAAVNRVVVRSIRTWGAKICGGGATAARRPHKPETRFDSGVRNQLDGVSPKGTSFGA